jgi:hypothetical protein
LRADKIGRSGFSRFNNQTRGWKPRLLSPTEVAAVSKRPNKKIVGQPFWPPITAAKIAALQTPQSTMQTTSKMLIVRDSLEGIFRRRPDILVERRRKLLTLGG